MGVKDGAVFTNGEPNATFLLNSTGCISDPKLCGSGITLSLWLKHANREAGQTFLSTGGSEPEALDLNRGFRIFQLNGSFDHIAVEMRNEFKRCLRAFSAPQNIWSHLAVVFNSISSGNCGIFKFFFNGELQSPLFVEEKSQNHSSVSSLVQIGDLSSGSPTAVFDDLAIWYEKFGAADISKFYNYYTGIFLL